MQTNAGKMMDIAKDIILHLEASEVGDDLKAGALRIAAEAFKQSVEAHTSAMVIQNLMKR